MYVCMYVDTDELKMASRAQKGLRGFRETGPRTFKDLDEDPHKDPHGSLNILERFHQGFHSHFPSPINYDIEKQ